MRGRLPLAALVVMVRGAEARAPGTLLGNEIDGWRPLIEAAGGKVR